MGAQPSALKCRIRLHPADSCAEVRTSLKGAPQAQSRTLTTEDVSRSTMHAVAKRSLWTRPHLANVICQMRPFRRPAATWQDALSHDEHDGCIDDFVQIHRVMSTLPNGTTYRIVRRLIT